MIRAFGPNSVKRIFSRYQTLTFHPMPARPTAKYRISSGFPTNYARPSKTSRETKGSGNPENEPKPSGLTRLEAFVYLPPLCNQARRRRYVMRILHRYIFVE